jgi:hypothetical protein
VTHRVKPALARLAFKVFIAVAKNVAVAAAQWPASVMLAVVRLPK